VAEVQISTAFWQYGSNGSDIPAISQMVYGRIINDSAGYVAPPEWSRDVVASGRIGQVEGGGWYRPTDGSRELRADDLGPPGEVQAPPIAVIALDL
jgi:hypothetical protein